jgi:hypothetical protein
MRKVRGCGRPNGRGELETARRDEPFELAERRVFQTPFDPGDPGLRGMRPAGERSL